MKLTRIGFQKRNLTAPFSNYFKNTAPKQDFPFFLMWSRVHSFSEQRKYLFFGILGVQSVGLTAVSSSTSTPSYAIDSAVLLLSAPKANKNSLQDTMAKRCAQTFLKRRKHNILYSGVMITRRAHLISHEIVAIEEASCEAHSQVRKTNSLALLSKPTAG